MICGISILALTAVKGTNGMVVFSWVYGASLGGYCYSLKVYTYERARARHFPRAWSFLQSSQAIPLFFGVPLTSKNVLLLLRLQAIYRVLVTLLVYPLLFQLIH